MSTSLLLSNEELEKLHEKIVLAIVESKMRAPDVLYVLRLLEQEIVESRMQMHFSKDLSKKEPLPMQ